MREIAERNGAELKVVWCTASPEVKLKRMKARASTREEDRTDDEVQALANKTDVPAIPFDHMIFDTGVEKPDPKGGGVPGGIRCPRRNREGGLTGFHDPGMHGPYHWGLSFGGRVAGSFK